MREKKALDNFVVPIDHRVKKLLLMFVGHYPTYSDAAKAVGLNRDTIARYLEGNSAIAAYALQRITEHLLEKYSHAQIDEIVGRGGVDTLLSAAVRKNGAATDNVSYAINDPLRHVLDAYARLFVNRAAAARALRINPRTFAAYFKATISSFPRDRFWRALEILRERGWDESKALAGFKTKSWDDVLLVARKQAPMSRLDDDALERALIEHIRKGELKIKTGDRPLFNACRRRYGNLTAALRAAMSSWIRKQAAAIDAFMEEGDLPKARAALDAMGEAIRHYVARAKSAARIPTLGEAYDWQAEVREYLAAKERAEDRIRGEEARTPGKGTHGAATSSDLYRALVEALEDGSLERALSDRAFAKQVKRGFEGIGRALHLVLSAAAAGVESRVRDSMDRGDLEAAVDEVGRLEGYVRQYVRWCRGATAKKLGERIVWRREVDKYIELRNRLKSQIMEARHQYRLGTEQELHVRFHHLKSYRGYSPEEDYRLGELVFHPVYGFGRVTAEEGRGRMQILFQPSRERVTLVRNL